MQRYLIAEPVDPALYLSESLPPSPELGLKFSATQALINKCLQNQHTTYNIKWGKSYFLSSSSIIRKSRATREIPGYVTYITPPHL